MSEKKKGKGLKTLLVIVLLLVVIAAGYICYLKGALNGILGTFDFTKDLVVQDLDIDKEDIPSDKSFQEYDLSDKCEAEYLVNEQGIVEVANIECELAKDTIPTEALGAAKTAAAVIKGVDFDYEIDDDGDIELDIKIAPGDIDQGVFDLLKDYNLVDDETIDGLKHYLDNPTPELINDAIKSVISN